MSQDTKSGIETVAAKGGLLPKHEWVGLKDEEMRRAAKAMDAEPLAEGWKELIKFARAIEAKLKEKNT